MSKQGIASTADLKQLTQQLEAQNAQVLNKLDNHSARLDDVDVKLDAILNVAYQIQKAQLHAAANVQTCALAGKVATQVAHSLAKMPPQTQEQLIEIYKVLKDTDDYIEQQSQVSWNSEVEKHFKALMDRLDWQVKVLGLDMQVDQLAREQAMYDAYQESLQVLIKMRGVQSSNQELLQHVHDEQASNQAEVLAKMTQCMEFIEDKFDALGHAVQQPVQMSARWELTKDQYKFDKILNEDYDDDDEHSHEYVKDEIGKGGFGTVYRGKFGLTEKAAIKEMPISELDYFKTEVNMLYRLEHGNIVGCYGGRVLKKTVHLVMAEMKGTLSDVVWPKDASAPPIPADQKWPIILDVARGLAYLHSVPRIVHRDVKPDNVLISFKGVCKLADFGLAKMTNSKYTGRNTARTKTTAGNCGTDNYKAPEVYDENQHTGRPVDVYAFGTLVFEVYTQTRP
jgi:hypothetical protein